MPEYITLTIPLPGLRLAHLTLPRDFTAADLDYLRAYLVLLGEAAAGRPCPMVLRAPEGEETEGREARPAREGGC